ncbi:copper resistance CopC/CopD family protein [Lacibacterium aquatile]|uniref:Copper resistance CopC/CopD family protein n=1 Tax=Lacibacterium aquatile TaxID=1168082 RepID=A0ABW5DME9_9PROT
MRILLFLLGLFVSFDAAAHAVLISITPGDGARVAEVPAEIALTFNEPVSPEVFTLIGPDGTAISVLPAVGKGANVSQPLPKDLPQGPYLLRWKVISADGHTIINASAFGIGASVSAAGNTSVVPEWRSALAMAIILPLGLAALGGALLPPNLDPTWRRRAAEAALFALALSTFVRGDFRIGEAMWQAGVAAAGLLLLRLRRPVAYVGAALTALGLGLDGHAAIAGWAMLMPPLHVAFTGFWLAGLIVLVRHPVMAAEFGDFALWLVPVIPLAGLGFALAITGGPDSISTPYAGLMIGKIAVMVILTLLAAFNRWRLVPLKSRFLRTSLRIELGLVMAAVLAGAVAQATPPRKPPPQIAYYHLHGGGFHGEGEFSPDGSFSLLLIDEEKGEVATVKEVTLVLDGLSRPAKLQPEGNWLADFGQLPPGRKPLQATILVDDFTRVTLGVEP